MSDFKSGFVSIIGIPNVGKSTILNSMLGEKVAIITNKPQTTRNIIKGISTNKDVQIIFVDTPGIQNGKSKLGQSMLKMSESSIIDVDVVLFVVSAGKAFEDNVKILERLKGSDTPVFLVINKIDTVDKTSLLSIIEAYSKEFEFAEVVPISALKGDNLLALKDGIIKYLPEGPQYFPADTTTDQSDKFLIAEMIREKALYVLEEEIPHGIAVEITVLKNREDKPIIDIDATIFCEKKSHKGIIIGKGGEMLKEIGTKARLDIQRLYDEKINLQLWVKVKENWRDSDFYIKNFGLKAD